MGSARRDDVGTARFSQVWQERQRGTVLEIFYGSGSSFPQYAALHLDSGYFRMVHSPYSG